VTFHGAKGRAALNPLRSEEPAGEKCGDLALERERVKPT